MFLNRVLIILFWSLPKTPKPFENEIFSLNLAKSKSFKNFIHQTIFAFHLGDIIQQHINAFKGFFHIKIFCKNSLPRNIKRKTFSVNDNEYSNSLILQYWNKWFAIWCSQLHNKQRVAHYCTLSPICQKSEHKLRNWWFESRLESRQLRVRISLRLEAPELSQFNTLIMTYLVISLIL